MANPLAAEMRVLVVDEANADGPERRYLGHAEVRLKQRAADAPQGALPIITGYGVRFNELSDVIGSYFRFREKVDPGAFAAVLADPATDCRALGNHDAGVVLGRQSAGTLRLFVDQFGLRYEIDPPNTQAARDLIENIRLGNVRESSFSFRLAEGGETWDEKGDIPVRTVTNVLRLFDLGPVTFAAYPTTTAAVRSLLRAGEERRSAAANQSDTRASQGGAPPKAEDQGSAKQDPDAALHRRLDLAEREC